MIKEMLVLWEVVIGGGFMLFWRIINFFLRFELCLEREFGSKMGESE